MQATYLAVGAFLLLTLAAALARIVRGPHRADRMMGAQLMGTTGVAILLLLAEAMSSPALRDGAMVLALLAVLAVVAFVRRFGPPAPREE